jgi:5-methylcytosine-specific restriction endonuclease McrA
MLNSSVLVLNRSYLPIHVTSARRAFALLYQGLARVVDAEHRTFGFEEWFDLRVVGVHDVIGTSRGPVRVPRVVLLTVFDRMPRRHVRFSRSNVMTRDAFTCQYCGVRPPRAELNLDHVVPRAHGGRSTWENVVASCVGCNRSKGGRTPEQAGLRLRRPPARPRWTPLAALPLASARHEEWRPFLRVVDGTRVSQAGPSGHQAASPLGHSR